MIWAALAATAVAAAAGFAGSDGADPWRLGLAVLSLALSLTAAALLAIPEFVTRLRHFVDGRRIRILAVAGLLLCAYFPYWVLPGNRSGTGLLALAAWIAAPTVVAILWPRRTGFAGEALVILAIWLPVEFRFVREAYPWPPRGAGALLAAPTGLALLVFLLAVVRDLDMGYVARLTRRDLRSAILAFALFALAGIPFGLWSGFLHPAAHFAGLGVMALRAVLIFCFTALPEEALFRGAVQRLLERSLRGRLAALLAASLLFGLAHLNNGPRPDWRYGVLATVAGLAYGWTYRRTGRLAAPALTHLLVDLTWSIGFKG